MYKKLILTKQLSGTYRILDFFFVQYVEGVSQFILRNLHKLRYNCLPSLAHTRDYNLYFGQNMYF